MHFYSSLLNQAIFSSYGHRFIYFKPENLKMFFIQKIKAKIFPNVIFFLNAQPFRTVLLFGIFNKSIFYYLFCISSLTQLPNLPTQHFLLFFQYWRTERNFFGWLFKWHLLNLFFHEKKNHRFMKFTKNDIKKLPSQYFI